MFEKTKSRTGPEVVINLIDLRI